MTRLLVAMLLLAVIAYLGFRHWRARRLRRRVGGKGIEHFDAP